MTEPEYRVQFRFGSGMTPMVKRILIVTLAVSGALIILGLISPRAAESISRIFGIVPRKALLGLQIWRFVTYALIHSFVDPFHLLFNMLGLFFFGPDVERHFRSQKKFLIFYIAAAATGGLFQALFSLSGNAAIIGASGAVYAVIISCAVLQPNRMVILFIFPIKLKFLAILFVGMNVLQAIQAIHSTQSYTAYFAHLGGAAFGFMWMKGQPWFRRFKQKMDDKAEINTMERGRLEEEELDRLLKKVHEQGLSSLSKRERDFMMKKSGDYKEKGF